MAIVEKIQLDTRQYMQSLSSAEKAAVRHAQKQENAYKNARRTMSQLEGDIKNVELAIKASNSPESVKRYQKALNTLKADYSKLEGSVKKYETAVKGMGDTTQKESSSISKSFKGIANSAKLFIAGATVGAIYALTRAFRSVAEEQIRFDQAMTESLAIQGKVTLEQRDRMIKTAREVASELNMTTDEVAKGYFFLASAGLDVEQQISNLGAVARFSRAGMFDMATATDLATDAQSALGLTVKNSVQNQQNLIRVTDVLSKANSMANASIQQFSESLTNKGATALKNYSKEIEEGVAVLAVYADQGVKDRIAGERLNILLKRLAESAKENAEEFDKLNVSVFDQEGRFRNVADIVGDLERTLKGLTDQQKFARLAQLGFTAETQDAILPLLGLSEQIKTYENNLRDAAGMTQEISDKQLQSLGQRFVKVKRQLVGLFGDDTLRMLEAFADALEPIGQALEKFAEGRTDRQIIDDIAVQEDLSLPKIFSTAKKAIEEQRKETEKARDELRLLVEDVRFFNAQIEDNPNLSDAYQKQIKTTITLLENAKKTYSGNSKILEGLLKKQRELGNTDAIVNLNIAILENKERLEEATKAYNQAVQSAGKFAEIEDTTTTATLVQKTQIEAVGMDEYKAQVVDPIQNLYQEFVKIGSISEEESKRIIESVKAMSTALGQEINEQFSPAFQNISLGSVEAEKRVKEQVNAIIESYEQSIQLLREDVESGVLTEQELKVKVNLETANLKKELEEIEDVTPNVRVAIEAVTSAYNIEDVRRTFSQAFAEIGTETDRQIKAQIIEIIQEYDKAILALQESFHSGVLSEQELNIAVNIKTDTFKKDLLLLEEQLRKTEKLSPELQKSFSKAFKTLSEETKDADKDVKNLGINLDNIADAISGVLSLADSFGVLSKEMSTALRGSVDLLRNFQNLQKVKLNESAGFLDFAIPGIGIATSAISILKGVISPLFGGDEGLSQEEIQDLELSMNELTRAVKANTKAFLEDAVIGGGISQSDIGLSEELINRLASSFTNENLQGLNLIELQGLINEMGGFTDDQDAVFETLFKRYAQNVNVNAPDWMERMNDARERALRETIGRTSFLSQTDTLNVLKELGELFPDLFGEFESIYENLRDQGVSHSDALEQLLVGTESFAGIADEFKILEDNFGEFSNTLEGAIEEFRLSIQLGGVDTQDAIKTFIDRVRDLGTDIPDDIFNQIEEIDISTDEGKKLLNDLIADLFANRNEFQGDLSPNIYSELLKFIQDFKNGIEAIDVSSVQDAINAFSARIRYGGVSVEKSLKEFIDDFMKLEGVDTQELTRTNPDGTQTTQTLIMPGEITKMLEALSFQDLSTQEGIDFLNETIKNIFENQDELIGDMSEQDYASLLDFLSGLSGTVSDTDNEVVRSVSGVAGITEFQANDLNVLLEAQLFEAGRQTELLSDILNNMLGGNLLQGVQEGTQNVNSTSTQSINLGGVSVNSYLSDQDISSITMQIANELKRQRQGGQFG